MATRFAISAGNFSNGAIWDNGSVPLSTDDIYANGFAIAVNTDITALSLRSTLSNVYLPNIATPAMTSNTSPSGTVFANANAITPWYAFDQNNSNYYDSNTTNGLGVIGYQFPTGKVIKRYFIRNSGSQNNYAKTWTFEGSNDGFATAGVVLDTVASFTTNGSYISGLLANTTSYTHYRLNITAVYNAGGYRINIYEFEMTESTLATPVYGAFSGGAFNVTDSKNITLTGTQGLFSGSISVSEELKKYVLNINTSSPNVVNVNCGTNFLTYLASGEGSVLYLTIAGSGTTNITGNVYRTMNGILTNSPTGTININGNITSGTRGSTPTGCVILNGTATYNIIGNLSGDPLGTGGSSPNVAVVYSGSGTLNITGTISGNLTPACSFSGTGTINISGTITASTTREAISGGSSFVNILTGIITAGTGNNAIISSGSALYTLGNSPLINTNNNMAIASPRIKLYSTAQVQWLFQNSAGTNTILYSAGASLGLPLTTNVRYPVQYGASNELTGQLIMPLPSNVRVGVPTDNTVGTGQLTAADFLAAIAVSPDPVAERLRTVSTVDTTGDQMAAYNV
jgi:hypothetical protein